MTPIRIALTGSAGAGKTLHARMLQKELTGDVLSFASPLKKVVKELFGDCSEEQYREALQAIGVAARKLDPSIWVDKLLAKVSPDRPCMVDDCRFYNEAHALRALGFVIVRVDAPIGLLIERRPGMTHAQRLHASEVEMATIQADFVVMTDQPEEAAHQEVLTKLYHLHPEWEKKKRAVHAAGGNA